MFPTLGSAVLGSQVAAGVYSLEPAGTGCCYYYYYYWQNVAECTCRLKCYISMFHSCRNRHLSQWMTCFIFVKSKWKGRIFPSHTCVCISNTCLDMDLHWKTHVVLHDYFSCLYVEVGGSTVQCSENTDAFYQRFNISLYCSLSLCGEQRWANSFTLESNWCKMSD